MIYIKKHMSWYLIVLAFLFSSSVHADTVKVCSLDRAGLSEADGSGYYWDLIRAVFKAEGLNLEYTSAPFKRCFVDLEAKRTDGAVALLKNPERNKKFTYPKSRLGYSSYGLVYLKETSFKSVEEVSENIGKIRGYNYSAWLPDKLNIVNVDNIPQAIEMLKRKRISYHADDIQDVLLALNKMKESSESFVFTTLVTYDLYLPFRKDDRGQFLADKFDSGLRKVYENGTLADLIAKHNIASSILPDFN